MPELTGWALDLYAAARLWWLTEESGPALLFGVRMASAALALSAAAAWYMLARADVLESTWHPRDVVTFRLLTRLAALGLFAVAFYFLAAGTLEAERTSSPHRLIVANIAQALALMPLTLYPVFKRYTYARKRAELAARRLT